MPGRIVRFSLLLAVGVALAAPAAASAAGPFGSLTQLAGLDGCWSLDGASQLGAGTCRNGIATNGPYNVVISPDGRNAYVTAFDEPGLAVFSRDPATGALTQLAGADGCFTADGSSGDGGAGSCTNARAMGANNEGRNIAISSDGRFLYFGTATAGEGILSFERNTETGRLTQLAGTAGCITNTGASEDGAGTCANGRNVGQTDGLALSGNALYGTGVSGIKVLGRNEATGVLTQLADDAGCITSTGASEDGPGTCTNGKAVNYSNSIAASGDGRHVYVVAYNDAAVSAFSRDATTGALTQLSGTDGCISSSGASDEGADTCTDGRALGGVFGIDISPDGNNVYAGRFNNPSGLVALGRDAESGRLTQLPGTAGCLTVNGASEDGPSTCQDSRASGSTYDVQVSPDGLNVYTGEYQAIAGTGGAVTAYRRDAETGALVQLPGTAGCVSDDGSSVDDGPGTCAAARVVAGSGPLGVSPDGLNVYAPGYEDHGFAILSREVPPGCTDTSTQSTSAGVAVPLVCADRNNEPVTREIVTAPGNGTLGTIDQAAGTVTYTPKAGFEGTDTLTFRGTGGGELPSNVATATIAVNDTEAASCRPSSARARLARLRKGSITLRLRCSEGARVTAELLSTRKRSRVLGKGTKRAGDAGTVRVKVKLKRKARRTLRGLSLRQAKKLKLALRVTTRDNGGNRGRKNTKLKLKR